jgi:uncharacterized protein (DUF885 family)
MSSRVVLSGLLVVSALACGPRTGTSGPPPPPPTTTTDAVEALGRIASDFVTGMLAFSPANATINGYHEARAADGSPIDLDVLLDDMSVESVARRMAELKEILRRLETEVPADGLDLQGRADLTLLRDAAELEVWSWEDAEQHRRNPTLWVEQLGTALVFPLSLAYDPPADRARDVIARLGRVPEYVERARATLVDAPQVWVDVAIQENDGNRVLVRETLPQFIRDECGGDAELTVAADAVGERALAAIDGFDAFLRETLPRADAEAWRLGPERFARKFALVFHGDATPEELLAQAEADLEAERARMLTAALALLPELGREAPADAAALPPGEAQEILRAVLDRIGEDHATRDGLLAEAQADLDEAAGILAQGAVLSRFQHENLEVVPTPIFMRGIYGVTGLMPAPPFQPELGSFFWVTPIPADWTDERAEQKLREYNRDKLMLIVWHEAMPGEYTQFEYANRAQPTWRRILRSVYGDGAYIEGWATYAEEVMQEITPLGQDPKMILTYAKEELRGFANVILDIRLHTTRMTDDEAMALMTERTFQERPEAEGKLQRAKLSSTQLCTYYVGENAWRDIRRAAQAAAGDSFSLRAFHDRALGQGAIPLPFLREMMLGTP